MVRVRRSQNPLVSGQDRLLYTVSGWINVPAAFNCSFNKLTVKNLIRRLSEDARCRLIKTQAKRNVGGDNHLMQRFLAGRTVAYW